MRNWQVINNKPVMRTNNQITASRATGYAFNSWNGRWMKLYHHVAGERYRFENSVWLYVDPKIVPQSVMMAELLAGEE